MVSDKQLEANRLNALRSTGPKTPEGKFRASRNAVKHGLTAESVVLPNEDPAEYEARLQEWLGDFPPRNAIERSLIDRAMHNSWKLDRIARRERAVLGKQMRHAVTDFELAEQIQVEEIGRKLMWDPINRCATAPKDPESLKKFDEWLNDDPPVLTLQLKSTVTGIDWMLKQWDELYGLLDREGYWHYNDKFRAIRLMGKRFFDLLDDNEIAMIFVTAHAAHPEAWDMVDEAHQARLGLPGKPMYNRRIEWLKTFEYTEVGEACKELKKLVVRQKDKLKQLRVQLAPTAEADRAEAVDRAMFDGSKEGMLFRRYETACERELHRAIADLMKSRKESAKSEPDGSIETPQPLVARASAGSVEAPSARPDRPLRNEPAPEPWYNPHNPQNPPRSNPEPAPPDAR
jgi:hypothetical protein